MAIRAFGLSGRWLLKMASAHKGEVSMLASVSLIRKEFKGAFSGVSASFRPLLSRKLIFV